MINMTESYLKYLEEKEWDEDAKWEDHVSRELLKQLIAQLEDDDKISLKRQSIQPTLLDLIKNTGGDYMGRETTKNSNHGDFSGIEYILKKMPKDWQEKVKQYVVKIATKHRE